MSSPNPFGSGTRLTIPLARPFKSLASLLLAIPYGIRPGGLVRQMIKQILLGTVFVILMLSEGCQQNHLTRTDIDASSIPDQTYEVTVHTRFMSRDHAVLFDIPDDGVEVFMRHTSSTQRIGVRHTASTEKIGRDSPRRYIDEFQNRIKYYQTVSIADKQGTVLGYLMVSSALNYWISPAGDRIMVGVERDSSYNYRLP